MYLITFHHCEQHIQCCQKYCEAPPDNCLQWRCEYDTLRCCTCIWSPGVCRSTTLLAISDWSSACPVTTKCRQSWAPRWGMYSWAVTVSITLSSATQTHSSSEQRWLTQTHTCRTSALASLTLIGRHGGTEGLIFEVIGYDSSVEDDGPGQVRLDRSGDVALVVEIHDQVHVVTEADLQGEAEGVTHTDTPLHVIDYFSY